MAGYRISAEWPLTHRQQTLPADRQLPETPLLRLRLELRPATGSQRLGTYPEFSGFSLHALL